MQHTVNKIVLIFCVFVFVTSNVVCLDYLKGDYTDDFIRYKDVMHSICVTGLLWIIKGYNTDKYLNALLNLSIGLAFSVTIDRLGYNTNCYTPNDYIILFVTILLYLLDISKKALTDGKRNDTQTDSRDSKKSGRNSKKRK